MISSRTKEESQNSQKDSHIIYVPIESIHNYSPYPSVAQPLTYMQQPFLPSPILMHPMHPLPQPMMVIQQPFVPSLAQQNAVPQIITPYDQIAHQNISNQTIEGGDLLNFKSKEGLQELSKDKDDDKQISLLQKIALTTNIFKTNHSKVRRKASEINRTFACPVKDCDKNYGSEGSKLQHLRLKHPSFFEEMNKELKSNKKAEISQAKAYNSSCSTDESSA